MTKKVKAQQLNKPVIWLFVTAVAIEAINVAYCILVSSTQSHTCPRDPVPAQLSTTLTIISALIALAAITQTKKEKGFTLCYALFHILVITFLYPFLQFYATGGLNWCNFTF